MIYGYEAARVAIRAIRDAGRRDRAAITAACLAIRDFPGAMGTWSFDANGDTTMRKMSGNIVHDGKSQVRTNPGRVNLPLLKGTDDAWSFAVSSVAPNMGLPCSV